MAGHYQSDFWVVFVIILVMAATMDLDPTFTLQPGRDFAGVGFIAHGTM